MKQQQFTVTGMSCAGCVAAVQKQLQQAKGVQEASVQLLEGRTLITYDETLTSPEQLQKEVQSIGYDMIITREEKEQAREREEVTARELQQVRRKMILTLGMLLLTMLLAHGWIPILHFSNKVVELAILLISSVVMFYSAIDYHRRALKQLRHGTFTMDTLISMSVSVAYFFSLIRYTFLQIPEGGSLFSNSYFDVVTMVMSFVLVGKYIEERAKYKTNDALRQLMAMAPETALVLRGGEWQEVPVEEIRVGDHIMLRRGDRLPVDGKLLEPATLEESSLTGEPLPQDKAVGDAVYSGTLSVGAVTTYVAEKIGSESLLGRIIEAVRKAQQSKAPIQRIADKVSGIFVPVVLGLALLTLLLWGLLGTSEPWLHGLYFAITLLCIACPCALGLATPTALTVAMGRASKEGLLIQDAVALEQLARVTDIVYDKTGTLTEGNPIVIEVLGEMTATEEALLVRAEQGSSHPLSQAILARFSMMESNAMPEELHEVAGEGLYFMNDGIRYHIGNKAPKELKEDDTLRGALAAHPYATLVYYTAGERLIALLVIEDQIRDGVPVALQTLEHRYGVALHLLSGDREERVQALARKLSIEQAVGGLSPLDKKAYIEALQAKGRVVAMVGDGINDSPALATADLSIAMGTGSDIANSVAQITSVSGSPFAIGNAIALSKKTVQVIHQNFFWAFLYNLLALPIAAGLFYPHLFVTPMIAAAAMACSSICVVLNSLRLRK